MNTDKCHLFDAEMLLSDFMKENVKICMLGSALWNAFIML